MSNTLGLELAASPKDQNAPAAEAGSANLFSEAAGWACKNVINPAINAGVIHPYAGLAGTANDLLGRSDNPLFKDLKPLEVDKANFLGVNWFAQTISSGVGGLVPYIAAGKLTGSGMRAAGERFEVEGAMGSILRNDHVAMIAGAGMFDFTRKPGQGESRLGNAAAGMFAFGTFEAGGALSMGLATPAKIGVRLATGALAGTGGDLISAGIAGRKVTGEELLQAGTAGGVAGVALPKLQEWGARGIDLVNHTTGRGVPIERYVSRNFAGADQRSSLLGSLMERSPWTRIQDRADASYTTIGKNKIFLAANEGTAQQLGHELGHLTSSRSAEYEPHFQEAARLVQSPATENEAYAQYRSIRVEQELAQLKLEQQIARELGVQTPAFNENVLRSSIGTLQAKGDTTYDQLWQREFQQFKDSGGKFRPDIEYGGDGMDAAEYKIQREIATKLVKQLQDDGHIAVFAGGAVRDELLGLKPKDFDIATAATPDQIEKLFKDAGMQVYPKGHPDQAGQPDANAKAYGVMSVKVDGREFEIATLRKDGEYKDGRRPDSVEFVKSLKEDAARRDLTINSMFLDPISGQLHDFFGGRQDLTNGVLRAVGDANLRFNEDRLRMLRVARFAAKFPGFSVDPELMSAIKVNASSMNGTEKLPPVSGERIREELFGTLQAKDPVRGLQVMMSSGLMKEVFPEIYRLRGPKGRQDPVWHPEKTTWTHTKLVLDQLNGSNLNVMLGGLLHDVGKPDTQVIHESGGISNHGHDAVGADIARGIMQRLRMPNEQQAAVEDLVRLHMMMHHVQEMRPGKLQGLLERKDIMDLIAIQHADSMGRGKPIIDPSDPLTAGRTDWRETSQREWLLQKLDALANASDPAQRLGAKPIVDGKTLIDMGYKPGPAFSHILENTLLAQREGEISTADAGRRFITENFPHLKGLSFNQQWELFPPEDAAPRQ